MKNAPAKVTQAHELYSRLTTAIKMGRLAGVMLGKYLFELKTDNNYQKAVGEGVDTWNDFLKMPEVGVDPREATRAMEIYEEFCIKRGYSTEMLAEAGVKTLHYLLPSVKRNEIEDQDIGELLKAGAQLPQNSFKERLQDFRGGTRHFEFMVMRKCKETGTMQKVHDINNEALMEAFPFLVNQLLPEII